ncbi:hypothetical protein COCNU_04G007160 [Cocos nucifera]|uniref:Pentatricopeptide repeat-containing protein n=1 Tax=Cocos nucifera TaxID=13894 RepID=A0A8K0I5M5_COCNU|nr:hypothetical protein COCNU_04G007160 [Cocos nucifera]
MATAPSDPPNPPNPSLNASKPPQPPIWVKPTPRTKQDRSWEEKRLVGFVDYDKGRRCVSTEVSGVGKDRIPARYRLRVEGSRWQKDWKVSEVVDQVLRVNHWEDIDGVLNCWVGRFARKNFPLLIRIPPSRTTYNNLISSCGSGGNWKEALEICKTMTENGVGPDLVTHNIVLSAFKNGAQYSKALAYFELMKKTNICPDTITLNIVIHCLVKLGQFGKAIENCKAVFDMMLAEGLKPNIISYNALLDTVSYTSLLNAYGRSGQPEKAREEAVEVLREMERNVLLAAKSRGIKLNIVGRYMESQKFVNEMMDMQIPLSKEGQLTKAESTFNMMKETGCFPDVITYTAMIHAYSIVENWKKAWEIFQDMEKNDILLDPIACSSLMEVLNRGCQHTKVLQMAELMRQKHIPLNSSAAFEIISACSI